MTVVSTSDELAAISELYADALVKLEFDQLVELYTEDVDVLMPGADTVTGSEQIRELLRGLRARKGTVGCVRDRLVDWRTMGIVQRETGQGHAHHHAPVRDYVADAREVDRTSDSLEHWKCLGVGCAAQWALPPGEKPRS